MKLQLMIEIQGDTPEHSSIEELQDTESRYLRVLGVERYVKNLLKTAMNNSNDINAGIRVMTSE